MKKLALLIFTLPITLMTFAQTTEFGLTGGVATYSGDLTPEEIGLYVKQFQPAYGVFVRFQPIDRIGLRLAFNGGWVSGDDRNGANPERGLNFTSSIMEVSALAEVETFRIYKRRGNNYLALYLFGGGGLFRFDPQTEFEGNKVALQPIGTEGQGLPRYGQPYRLTQFNVPFGLGLKYVISTRFTIGVEFGGRKLFTDYLDDVGHARVNYEELRQGKGAVAAQLSYPNWEQLGSPAEFRRGGSFNDWYYIAGVTFSYFVSSGGGGKRRDRYSGCYSFGK